jgi:hypothetical protein
MTQHRYDVYGVRGLSLDTARSIIEAALGLSFTERESGYYGGKYYKHRLGHGQEVMLFNNFDDARADWVRRPYKDYHVLLEVSDFPDMNAIQRRLLTSSAGITLLRTRTIDDTEQAP